MKMLNKRAAASLLGGLLLSLTLPGAAQATGTFHFTSTKIDPTVGGLVGTIHFTYPSGGKTKTLVETANIGRLQLAGTLDGKAALVDSYCVDIFDVLKPGNFSPASLTTLNLSPVKLSQLTIFLENADALLSSKKNAVYSAAAQLGAWEIVYETSGKYDVTKGAFWVSGGNLNGWNYSATQLANTWLTDLTQNIWKPIPGSQLSLLSPGKGNQPQVYVTPASSHSTPPGAVPEPASWVTMIAGFGLVGASMRSRRIRLKAA